MRMRLAGRRRGLPSTLLALACSATAGCGGGSGPTAPTTTTPQAQTTVLLTSATFDAQVIRPGVVAMVEFYSPRCSHCRAMEPIVEAAAREFEGRALVAQVNVDAEPALAARFQIVGYPTFLFFEDGAETQRLLGTQTYGTLVTLLASALGGS